MPCIAFDKAAEFAEKYFHQGTKLIVTGRIQTGSYTNKDGQKVYTTDIVVEEQEFAESKAAGNEQAPSAAARPNLAQASMPKADAHGYGFMNIPDGVEDGDLPFN